VSSPSILLAKINNVVESRDVMNIHVVEHSILERDRILYLLGSVV
jgi:hypothetical protein